MIDFIRAGGFNMFILLALGVAILIPAARFARSADPQRLALIRALTCAISFVIVVGLASGIAATCKYVITEPEAQKEPVGYLLAGIAETLTNAMLGGGVVAIAWILVAVGVRRMPAE